MKHARLPVPVDCRPLYPEVVAFGAPRGMRARLQDRARQEGTSVSELIRRALASVTADPRLPSSEPRMSA